LREWSNAKKTNPLRKKTVEPERGKKKEKADPTKNPRLRTNGRRSRSP